MNVGDGFLRRRVNHGNFATTMTSASNAISIMTRSTANKREIYARPLREVGAPNAFLQTAEGVKLAPDIECQTIDNALGSIAMKTLLQAFLCISLIPSVALAQKCPAGAANLICGGKTYPCEPLGSSCCSPRVGVCAPGTVCSICNSQSWCVARGSQCCFSIGFCNPGTHCTICASQSACIKDGTTCPKPGTMSLDALDRFLGDRTTGLMLVSSPPVAEHNLSGTWQTGIYTYKLVQNGDTITSEGSFGHADGHLTEPNKFTMTWKETVRPRTFVGYVGEGLISWDNGSTWQPQGRSEILSGTTDVPAGQANGSERPTCPPAQCGIIEIHHIPSSTPWGETQNSQNGHVLFLREWPS